MTLSDFSIKNPVFAWMLMIGIIVFGWIGFKNLGVSQLPDVDFPIVSVSVTWEGAAPEVMETEVTDILENAVMSVQGIKEISSTSGQSQSQITIELDLNRDIDAALQDVQSKISQAQRNLPDEIDPPVVSKTNPEDQPIMWMALSGDRPMVDLVRYVNDVLKDQFTTVAGVGDVRLGGYVDPNLRVWLNAKKMKEQEITVEDVLDAIGSQHADLPAGYIDTGPREINVRVYGEATTAKEFGDMVIPSRVRAGPVWNGLKISDIGAVEDGLADIRRISRSGGRPAIGLGIVKQRGTNAVAVAEAVKKKMKIVQTRLPENMQLEVVFDTTRFIKDSVHVLTQNLLYSVILTSLVCFFFLGSWSATLNVLLAIPTSLLGAFFVIYFLGFTINTFTMLGLSLVIGVVVDDAIMVLENISRYQEKGLSRMQAAFVGAREITFAALAASIAILAIFIPVIFMKGMIGKFFFQFGVTISVAVMFSLLEALTIAPMRCSRFLDVGHTTKLGRYVDDKMRRLNARYRSALEFCLKRRVLVVVVSAAIFAVSIGLFGLLKKEFVPSQDQSRFLVRIVLPLGSSMGATDEVFKKAEKFLMEQPASAFYYSAVGGFGGGQPNQGNLFVTMKPLEKRPMVNGHRMTQSEYMQICRKEFNSIPGVQRAVIQDLSQAGFTAQRGFPVEFTVRGPDWKKLADISEEIMKQMKETGLMVDIDTDYRLGQPELQIRPDRAKAAAHRVDIHTIADAINATIGGIRAGKFTSNGKRYDVRVRLAGKDRAEAADIGEIFVRNQVGESVPLSAVVTYEEVPTLSSITRKNRERAISIYANPAAGTSQQDALSKVQEITKKALPSDYHAVFSGGSQAFKESIQSLIFALVLGLFVAYMVLATQFNSFIHPVTVLLALPFSITGAAFALYVSRQSLNLYSMIGLILLMGIVKKNSILLVDFTNERRRQGSDVRTALLEACPIRLRPILMTSVATVAAALPEAFARGSGSETIVPMAVAIVGGVTFSTVLTLFVVPCAYEIFSKFEKNDYRPLEEAAIESPPGSGVPHLKRS